jgi:hypothetical protein
MTHANMKLGRIRPTSKQRAKALPLAHYMTRALPVVPPDQEIINTTGAALGMWENDRLGDCTFAGLANYRSICAARENLPTPSTTDSDVAAAYLEYTGGKDEGAVETDVLNLGLKGVNLGGDPFIIASWVSIDLQDRDTVRSLLSLFWSLYLGVELPKDAQNQDVWVPTTGRGGAPGGWGGHCLLLSNYHPITISASNTTGSPTYGLVTWGAEKLCTLDWLDEYGDEGYLLLDAQRANMIGVDWDSLVSDMQLVSKE